MQPIKPIFLFALFALISISLQAQLSVQATGGLLTGSPLGRIPEGATGKPGLRLWAETWVEYRFAERLGLRAGVQFMTKASRYEAPVSGEQQAEANVFGAEIRLPFAFDYTGNVSGRFANRYWQIPLTLAWYNESRFTPFGGLYWAKNSRPYHRGIVNVEVSNGLLAIRNQSFDETPGIRGWDWGTLVGTDFKIIDAVGLSLQAQYGLISIFETNPEGLEGSFRNLYFLGGFYVKIGS